MQLLRAILRMFFFTSCVQQGEVELAKKVVHLHWYMHDTPYNGPNASSIAVTAHIPGDFEVEVTRNLRGQIYVFDDPLTVGPNQTSASFGRSQGSYSYVSPEELVAFVSSTVSIRSGKYNGSTLTIAGANRDATVVKEYPIVGGTGAFLLARGVIRETVVRIFGRYNASATLLERATIYLDK